MYCHLQLYWRRALTIRKYLIYIAIIAVLLTAWNYRESIEDRLGQDVRDVRTASPFIDDRIEGEIKHAMGR